jgi:hypothetical protein
MVRAGAAPRRRIDHVHRALRAIHEEPGATVADADPYHTLAAAREVGDEDVLGARDARGEGGTGGAYSGEFLLDAPRDGLDYTRGAHRTSLVSVGRASGSGRSRGAISLSDTRIISFLTAFVYNINLVFIVNL